MTDNRSTFIRPATAEDAAAVSQLIQLTLRQSNARDYPASVIARVESNFSREAVRLLIAGREAYVAMHHGRIVGTASLDENTVRTVFVAPDMQGRGVGRLLMAHLVESARKRGVPKLRVPSSLTAEPFYAKLGFRVLRENLDGDERTIVMELELAPLRAA